MNKYSGGEGRGRGNYIGAKAGLESVETGMFFLRGFSVQNQYKGEILYSALLYCHTHTHTHTRTHTHSHTLT